jgi:hypothetical protein
VRPTPALSILSLSLAGAAGLTGATVVTGPPAHAAAAGEPFTVVLPTVSANGNGWWDGPVDLEVRSSSPDDTPVVRIEWALGRTGPTGTAPGDHLTLEADSDGTTEVLARGIDAQGRVGGWATYTVRIDTVYPGIDLAAGGPYDVADVVRVPITCTDELSGIAGTGYGGDLAEDADGNIVIDTSSPGTKHVTGSCQDRAGNVVFAERSYEVRDPEAGAVLTLTGLPRTSSSRQVLRPALGLSGGSGRVRLLDGDRVLGSYAPGSRPAVRLAPGRHVLTAAWTTAAGTEVRSASTVVGVRSPVRVAATYRLSGRRLLARVALTGLDAPAVGPVALLDGSRVVGRGRPGADGRVSVRVRLAAGVHRLRVAYAGSPLTAAASSRPQRLRVR